MRFAGSLYLTAAVAIWGGMYVASKYVLDYIPPFTLLAYLTEWREWTWPQALPGSV